MSSSSTASLGVPLVRLRFLPSVLEVGALQTEQGRVTILPVLRGGGHKGRALVRRAPFFSPWISVAGAAVEVVGLTHPWEKGKGGSLQKHIREAQVM